MKRLTRVALVGALVAAGVAAAQAPASAQTGCVWSPDGGARLCVDAVAGKTPTAVVYDAACDGKGPTGYVKVDTMGYYAVPNGQGCNRTVTRTISAIAQKGDLISYYICNTNATKKSCSTTTSFRVP